MAGAPACPRQGSNLHWAGFKPAASADWATGARAHPASARTRRGPRRMAGPSRATGRYDYLSQWLASFVGALPGSTDTSGEVAASLAVTGATSACSGLGFGGTEALRNSARG